MSNTRQYLELLDRHLYGNEPSLARLVLEYGYQAPRLIECPKRYRGEPKRCYNNAAEAALDWPERYTYVEGYATGIIPTGHAWVWDRKQDAIFDPTWYEGNDTAVQTDPAEYIGLRFRLPYLRRYVGREGRAALIMADPDNAYKLMTDPATRKRALILKGGK